jgi:hypothetical protein
MIKSGFKFTALSAALLFAGASAAPALAKKKAAEAPKQAPAELSKEFRALVPEIQKSLAAKDFAGAQAKVDAASAVATLPDERYFLGSFRVGIGQGTNNDVMLRQGVNEMISAGSKQATNLLPLYAAAGKLAYTKGDYTDCVAKLKEAERLGLTEPEAYIVMQEALAKLNRGAEAMPYAEKAIANWKPSAADATQTKPPASWYSRPRAIAFNASLPAEVNKWSMRLIRAYPSPKNWYESLDVARRALGTDSLAVVDLYRLMHDAKALNGDRDVSEYAELASSKALFGETKSVVEEAIATGAASKTRQSLNERLTEARNKIAADQAALTNDEKLSKSDPQSRRAANTANALIGYGQNARAIELLKLALTKAAPDTDSINMRLGIALSRSGQKAEAAEAFKKVSGTRRDLAQFWLLWLEMNV